MFGGQRTNKGIGSFLDFEVDSVARPSLLSHQPQCLSEHTVTFQYILYIKDILDAICMGFLVYKNGLSIPAIQGNTLHSREYSSLKTLVTKYIPTPWEKRSQIHESLSSKLHEATLQRSYSVNSRPAAELPTTFNSVL